VLLGRLGPPLDKQVSIDHVHDSLSTSDNDHNDFAFRERPEKDGSMTSEQTMLSDAVAWEEYPVAAGLASGQVPVRIGRVGSGGPVALLSASVHGDEGPWGTLAINRLLQQTPLEDLTGSLRVVPVAHPLATEADARHTELDLLDLNSSFPGDPSGSHTQRLAAVLAQHAVDGTDVVLDVHGGGSWLVNCFVYRFPGSHDLADTLRAPLLLDGPDRPSSLSGYARSQGAVAVWIEMGGKGDQEEQRIEAITACLRRALIEAGVLAGQSDAAPASVVGGEKAALATSAAGIYRPVRREADLGQIVERGTVIGQLLDPVHSTVIEEYTAPFDHTFLALLRPHLVRIEGPGKVVAMVADVPAGAAPR
jgi:predicted deacylase